MIETLGRAGAEQALVNLLPTLQARGHICEVAALWPSYALAEDLEAEGIRVHRLGVRHRWSLLEGTNKLSALIRQRQPDVLHAHLYFAGLYTGLSQILVPRPRRVISLHCMEYEMYPTRTPSAKIRRALDYHVLHHRMQGYVAVTPAVADHYETEMELKGIKVIPNAFPVHKLKPDPALMREAVLSQAGVNPNRFVFLMAARLVPLKGHRFLFDALQLLGERGVHPQALIIGDGPLRSELEQGVIARGLQEQVIFRGKLPHSEVMKLMQAADATVLASTYEGFGLAPAEAMLMERPVLVTDVGGLRSVVEDKVSGLVVPPEDPSALAAGMELLMSDKALGERLGRAGRQRIIAEYSAETAAFQLENCYLELLNTQNC